MQQVTRALTSALQHQKRGDHAAAARDFLTVISRFADHPDANLHLSQYARNRGDFAAARTYLTAALGGVTRGGLREPAVTLFAELSALERETGDGAAALKVALAGQSFCGEAPRLLWQECEALRLLNQSFARLHRLNRLARLQPNDSVILTELGLALLATASAPQAVGPLRRAIELGMDDVEVTLALAGLEIGRGDIDVAQARLEELIRRAPTHLGVLATYWFTQQKQCRWEQASTLESELLRRLEKGERHAALSPFMLLLSNASPALLRDHLPAHHYSASKQMSPPAVAINLPLTHRLKVGYLSADLHEHATAILIAGLFEHHDRERFELFAYSYGPRVEDAYRTRLKSALPSWRDLNDLSDEKAAATIRGDSLDVLIEMKGHTLGARLKITALRPAPIIIHYLGYPGTLASDGIDYLVADQTIVPVEHESFYNETILRMPGSYQANDTLRPRPTPTARAELGLPQDAVVLCNFNQSAKWTAPFFCCWLRALKRSPRAILWLQQPNATAQAALMELAYSMGVGKQIVWAPVLPPQTHLARLGAADLAMDQLPCASHTTGADALWMGVPLLTCLGEAFHGRVGASLARAVDLPEFITHNIDEYEQRLGELLDHPEQIEAAKQHLSLNRHQLPLFNTQQFTRDWEALLTTTYQRAAIRDATRN